MDKKVVIYSTSTCHFCHMAKEFFTENNVAFEDVNLSENPARINEMVEKSGQRGVPVIFVDNEMVIGFDEDRLKELLGL